MNFISQNNAIKLDEELMSPDGCGFSTEQLMELAGQAVAVAVTRIAPTRCKICVVCGPGNNGGDGLVAARHLFHFGYQPFICYPKRKAQPLFAGLVRQLEQLEVPFIDHESIDMSQYDAVVDAVFGFSFNAKGGIRAPFDALLKAMVGVQDHVPIISVDVPSGWDVETGDLAGTGRFSPMCLVSLTAPKPCARDFAGVHFLGGRFVPPSLCSKYGLVIPPYPGTEVIQELH